MKVCPRIIHKYFLQVTTLHVAQNYAILMVLAQLLTTLVWIECDGPDGSYFLEWGVHIFGFCAKSHIIISLLSFVPKVILSFLFCLSQWAFLSWLVALLFSFSFEWLLMGCFLCLEFSVLTCPFIGNQKKTCLFIFLILVSLFTLYNFFSI